MRAAALLTLAALALVAGAASAATVPFEASRAEVADGLPGTAWRPSDAEPCVEVSFPQRVRVAAYRIRSLGPLRAWNLTVPWREPATLVDRRAFARSIARDRFVPFRAREPVPTRVLSLCVSDPLEGARIAGLEFDAEPAPYLEPPEVEVRRGCDGVPGSGATYDLEGVCGGGARDPARPVDAWPLAAGASLPLAGARNVSLYVRWDANAEDPSTAPLLLAPGVRAAVAASGALYASGARTPCVLPRGAWARLDASARAGLALDGAPCAPADGDPALAAAGAAVVGGAVDGPQGVFALPAIDGSPAAVEPADLAPAERGVSVPNRPPPFDACGVRGGNGSACGDDLGVPFGPASTDRCGVPGGDGTSCADCDGVVGSSRRRDACRVCGGTGASCNACAWVDACGVCNGRNESCADCAGVVRGPARRDACGVCNGRNESCADCRGVPWGTAAEDVCGACMGGAACAGCDGVYLSGAALTPLGRCVGAPGAAGCPQEAPAPRDCTTGNATAGLVPGPFFEVDGYEECARLCAASRRTCAASAQRGSVCQLWGAPPARFSRPPSCPPHAGDERLPRWYVPEGPCGSVFGCDGRWGSDARNDTLSGLGGCRPGREEPPCPQAPPPPLACGPPPVVNASASASYEECAAFCAALSPGMCPAAAFVPGAGAAIGGCVVVSEAPAAANCTAAAAGAAAGALWFVPRSPCHRVGCDGRWGSEMRNASCALSATSAVQTQVCVPFGACRPPPVPRAGGCDGLGSEVDACGTCGGPFVGGLRCEEPPAPPPVLPPDLPDACRGRYDACGTCGGNATECPSAPCDGVAGSDRYWDRCGRCGGDGERCAGCDGRGGVLDGCGVCNGNNTSCFDCAGNPGGPLVLDRCNVCGGDGLSCVGCDGVALSGRTYDAYRVCGGNERVRRRFRDRCGARGGLGDGCAPAIVGGGSARARVPRGGGWSAAAWVRCDGAGVLVAAAADDEELGCRAAPGSAWVSLDASGRVRLDGATEGVLGPPLPAPFASWHHVALARGADGSATLFVNGTSVAWLSAPRGGAAAAIDAVAFGEPTPCGADAPAPGALFSDLRLWEGAADAARAFAEMTLPPGEGGPLLAALAPPLAPGGAARALYPHLPEGGWNATGTAAAALGAPILESQRAREPPPEDPTDPEPLCAFPSNACGLCAPHEDPDDPDASCPLDCDGRPLGPAVRGACGACDCPPAGAPPIPPPSWKATVVDPCTLASVRPEDAYACIDPPRASLRPLRPLELPVPGPGEASVLGVELWFADADPGAFLVDLAGAQVRWHAPSGGPALAPRGGAGAGAPAPLGPGPAAAGAWERLVLRFDPAGNRAAAALGHLPRAEVGAAAPAWARRRLRVAGARFSAVRVLAGEPPFLAASNEGAPAWALWPMNEGFGRTVHDAAAGGRDAPAPHRRWVLAAEGAPPNPVAFAAARPSCAGVWRGNETRDACGTCGGGRAVCPPDAPPAVVRDARWAGPPSPEDVVLPAAGFAACADLLVANRSEQVDPTFFGASYEPLDGSCTLHRLSRGEPLANRSLGALEREVGAAFVARVAAGLPPPEPLSPGAPAPTPPPFACASWVAGVCVQAPGAAAAGAVPPRGAAGNYSRLALVPRAPDARSADCAAAGRARGARWVARQARACWFLPDFDPAAAGGAGYAGHDAVEVLRPADALVAGTGPRLYASLSARGDAAVLEVGFAACPAGPCPSDGTPYACDGATGACARVRPAAPAAHVDPAAPPGGNAYAEVAPGLFGAVACAWRPCYDALNRGERYACVEGACVPDPAPPAPAPRPDPWRTGLLPAALVGALPLNATDPPGAYACRLAGATANSQCRAWCPAHLRGDPRGAPGRPRRGAVACPDDGYAYRCDPDEGAAEPCVRAAGGPIEARAAPPPPPPALAPPPPPRNGTGVVPRHGGLYEEVVRRLHGVLVPEPSAVACDEAARPGVPGPDCPAAAPGAEAPMRACPACAEAGARVLEPPVRPANALVPCRGAGIDAWCALACYVEQPGGAYRYEACARPDAQACNAGGGCAERVAEPAPLTATRDRATGISTRDVYRTDGDPAAAYAAPTAIACPYRSRDGVLYTSECPYGDGWLYACLPDAGGCAKQRPAWLVRATDCTVGGVAGAHRDECGACNGIGRDRCGRCSGASALECRMPAGTVALRLFGADASPATIARLANVTLGRVRAAGADGTFWIYGAPGDPAAAAFARLWSATSVPTHPLFSVGAVGAHRVGDDSASASVRNIRPVSESDYERAAAAAGGDGAGPAEGAGAAGLPPLAAAAVAVAASYAAAALVAAASRGAAALVGEGGYFRRPARPARARR